MYNLVPPIRLIHWATYHLSCSSKWTDRHTNIKMPTNLQGHAGGYKMDRHTRLLPLSVSLTRPIYLFHIIKLSFINVSFIFHLFNYCIFLSPTTVFNCFLGHEAYLFLLLYSTTFSPCDVTSIDVSSCFIYSPGHIQYNTHTVCSSHLLY